MLPGAGVDGFRREGQTEEDCQYTRCESCCKVEAIGMMNSCHNVELRFEGFGSILVLLLFFL